MNKGSFICVYRGFIPEQHFKTGSNGYQLIQTKWNLYSLAINHTAVKPWINYMWTMINQPKYTHTMRMGLEWGMQQKERRKDFLMGNTTWSNMYEKMGTVGILCSRNICRSLQVRKFGTYFPRPVWSFYGQGLIAKYVRLFPQDQNPRKQYECD